jgi:hypothetical protein
MTRRIAGLIQRSSFRALARLRYEIIGQDRALEQLFRTLSISSQQVDKSPIVLLLCGKFLLLLFRRRRYIWIRTICRLLVIMLMGRSRS